MLKDIRQVRYSPTLGIRPAEMRGLEELSEGDKSAIFPVVLLAPWVGSATLDRSLVRLQQAYGDRPILLDIDRDFASQNPNSECHQEFFGLQEPANGYAAWRAFVERHEQVVPVIQHRSGADDVLRQIEWAEGLGRGFDDPSSGIEVGVGAAISEIDHAEFAFLLDSKWSVTGIEHQMWMESASSQLVNYHANVPIVLSGSNFPKGFSDIDGVVRRTIGARRAFNAVRQSLNQPQFIYGDWASTKPRSYERGGQPLPRIDYAARFDWTIARSKSEEWGYPEAAQHLIASPSWRPNLPVWGANMIERTAGGDPFAITGSAKNVASRVNLHLHVQANFDAGEVIVDTDDPWVD